MHRKTVKYIGFYDFPNSISDRTANLAAVSKMNYLCSAIVNAGYNVHIISPSWMGNNTKIKFEKQKTIKINKNTKVTFCPSWKSNNKFSTLIKIYATYLWLFFYLICNSKKNEKILFYHTVYLSVPVRYAKHIKKFHLVLEVEELYCDVWGEIRFINILNTIEKKIINTANSYILVSDVIKEKLKINRSSLLLYGSYSTFDDIQSQEKSNFIELVYAGAIEDRKGGAFNSVKVIKYLPENYKLNILGHGNKLAISKLENLIASSNLTNRCKYLGIKTGEEYSRILSICDIALNSQLQGDYMNSAFPSKVVSYLAHNLRVVSTKIKSIEMSPFKPLIYFSDDDSPKAIANRILSIDMKQYYNSLQMINDFNKKFILDVKKFLN